MNEEIKNEEVVETEQPTEVMPETVEMPTETQEANDNLIDELIPEEAVEMPTEESPLSETNDAPTEYEGDNTNAGGTE